MLWLNTWEARFAIVANATFSLLFFEQIRVKFTLEYDLMALITNLPTGIEIFAFKKTSLTIL